MKYIHYNLLDRIKTVIVLLSLILLVAVTLQASPINAKATPVSELNEFAIDCSQVVDVYGKAETTINVNTEGRYRLWAKIRSANPGVDSFFVKIDGECFVLGNNSNTENWTWIDYVSGSNDRKFDLDVTAGPLAIEFYAREKGVQLDQIQLIGDTARCEDAYRSGSDCNDPNISETGIVEDLDITGVVEGSIIHTATLVQAIPHPSLDVNSVKFFVDGAEVRTDGSAPYCMQGTKDENCKSYDFTTLSEGNHILRIQATTNNAGVITKNINFTYKNTMHSSTVIDNEPPTVADDNPETEYPRNEEEAAIDNDINVETNESTENQNEPSSSDDESTEVNQNNNTERFITSILGNTKAEFQENQALITDTSTPTLNLENIISSDILLLNGQRIPASSTVNFSETGRNILSISNNSGTIINEYVIIIRYPDFDKDNKIGSSDLRKIISNWRTANDKYDLNGDGIISDADIRILINKWSEQQ